MRSTRRAPAVIGLLLVLALSLTACMHMDRSVALNGDGSGTYTLTIGFSEQLISLASDQISTSMNGFGDKVQKQGGSYRHYDDTGYSYWAYTRPFRTIAALNALVRETPQAGSGSSSTGSLPSTGHDTLNFTQQSGFLSNTFHVTGHMSMILPPSSSATSGGIDMTPFLKDMRESFSVTMPGSISSHQGGVVQGNTVTYTVHYGEETDIDVVGGGFDTGALLPIGIGVAVLLLLVIAALILWRLRRRSKGARPSAAQGQQDAPVFVPAASDAPTMPGSGAQPGGTGEA